MKEEVIGFVNFLEKERRYSDHTVTNYRSDLDQFLTYLDSEFDFQAVKDVQAVHVRSWLVTLTELKLAPKTVNRKLSSIRSFFQYLIRCGDLSVNPAALLKGPKLAKRLPTFLQKDEMFRLLGPELYEDDWVGLRDRLLIVMLYTCGLRRSEAIQLRELDLDRAKGWVKVMGKGSKERLVPISAFALELANQYLLARRQNEVFGEFLFVTTTGEPLYPKAVYNIVVKYLSLVTPLEYKGPHVLRHTFATHLTNEGAEIRAIQELLGHASLAATQVYTHNSIDKLKRAYRKAHPKA